MGARETSIASVERALLLDAAAIGSDVAAAVVIAREHYQAARYGEVLDGVPALIGDLDDGAPDDVCVAGYVVVAKLLTKLGRYDLALLAADRARVAAARTVHAADVGMGRLSGGVCPDPDPARGSRRRTRGVDRRDPGT